MERMVRRAKTEEAQERAKAEKYLNSSTDPSERPVPSWAEEDE